MDSNFFRIFYLFFQFFKKFKFYQPVYRKSVKSVQTSFSVFYENQPVFEWFLIDALIRILMYFKQSAGSNVGN
jgi:hypothetical protein